MSWQSGLSPQFRPWAVWLVQTAQENGFEPTVTSAYRSWAQQERLYRRFQAGQSLLPAAAPGRSKHNYGLAIDLVCRRDGGLRALGALWESVGGRWGGSRDPVHFEAP